MDSSGTQKSGLDSQTDCRYKQSSPKVVAYGPKVVAYGLKVLEMV